MFNNLIESCTHKNELKRKGSFFLATVVVYTLILSATSIATVVAYEAHLDNQSLEVYALLTPVQPTKTEEKQSKPVASKPSNNKQQVATRIEAISRVAISTKVPETISSTPSNTREVPERGRYIISNTDTDAVMPSSPGSDKNGTGGYSMNQNANQIEIPDTVPPPPPPPAVAKTPKPSKVSKGVVNGLAAFLPKPPYPPIAKAARASGVVSVQVLIDETGKVISATAISGNPLLRGEAVKAALQARFHPTFLSEVPVKVSGFINYNFAF